MLKFSWKNFAQKLFQIILAIPRILFSLAISYFFKKNSVQQKTTVQTKPTTTTSSFRTRNVNFTHYWIIENYSAYTDRAVSHGFALKSDPFSIPPDVQERLPENLRSFKYKVAIFPKGDSEPYESFTGIFIGLTPESDPTAHRVMIEYSIVDADGEVQKSVKISTMIKETGFFGFNQWIAVEEMTNPRNRYLSSEGNLTVRIVIHFSITESVKIPGEIEIDKKEEEFTKSGRAQLCDSLTELWLMRREYSDLVLEVSTSSGGEVEVQAHKAILVARSPVFRAMFRNKTTKESLENRICIPDMSVEVCEAFLEYLYTGVVKSLEEQAESLLPFADKYQIDHLKSICEESLCTQINSETADKLLAFAEMYNATKLMIKSHLFIKKRTMESIATLIESPSKVIKADQMLTKLLKQA